MSQVRNSLSSILVCAAVFVAMLATVPRAPSAPGAPVLGDHVPGEVLIRFQPDALASEVAGARSLLGASSLRRFRSGAERWKLAPGLSVADAIDRLRGNPQIVYVEPNYLLSTDVVPNDPRLDELWGMINAGQTGGTPDADIDADLAWGVSTGSTGVLVGVIDTGIDYNHPDLAANVWTNPGEIPANGIDDDGNGYVDDVHGYDFYNGDGDPLDDHGHGTHVSGTIGGIGDNGIGVAGVNWQVKIMALKFLSAGGSGSTADAVEAVDYSVMMGVDLTSNSWGGGSFSQALYDAIQAAGAQEMAFVAAAGNSNANNDVSPHYPSNYDLPNIIAVAATDDDDAKASFSSYGATSVDIGAPGVDILSTLPGNSYGLLSGTSMATPHVAGTCALIRAVSPGVPVAQMKNILFLSGDAVPSMAGITVSGKRLNAFFAIAEPDDVAPFPITDLQAVSPGSNTMELDWTATGDDGDTGTAANYVVRYSTSPIDGTNWSSATRAGGEPTPSPSGTPESMEVSGLAADTFYYFAIKAFDEWGNDSGISNLASASTLPPPTGSVSPTSLSAALFTGQQSVQQVTLSNVGVGTLDFTIPTPAIGEPSVSSEPSLDLAKGELDPRSLPPQIEGSGGPDAFGYRWIDSDDPGGPAFAWIDISGTGTPIAGLDADDENQGPLPLGFDFSFYGQTFDSIRVCTNGWLSFTSTATTYNNQPLPSASGPENLVAPFWDDLHFRGVERAYFESFGTSAIVQWQSVDRYSTGSNLTFQAILDSSGAITFQYLSLSGVTNSATVGIQNATKSDGLQAAFNQDYLHDGLAIRISAIPQWLTAAPTSGRLGAGESKLINVTMNAAGLEGGTYPGTVHVLTNDPAHPDLTVDVSLDVTGAPDAVVLPATLDFGDRFLGLPDTMTLTVRNDGTDTLHVSAITTSDPQLAASPDTFAVLAHGSQDVTITWTPTALGPFSGTVTVASDDAAEPTIDVPMTGNAIPAPIMTTTPTSFSETLYSGDEVTRTLTVRNTGGSDLIVDASADQGNGVVVAGGVGGEGSGGPDDYGYRWRDSDESGGPVFDWVDISGVGTWVQWDADNYCGSCNVGPFPLGFDFPFYGNTFSEVRASVTGFLSFTSAATTGTNRLLPDATSSTPENLIAPFWDILYSRNGTGAEPVASGAYYYNDGGRFIFQYDHFYRSGDTDANLTFQVILYPSGKIVFQYLTMDLALLNSATIGIQNATKDVGLTVNYNADYVHGNLAVEISRVPDWLSVTPGHAVVPPGGSFPFDVKFDATGRFGGLLSGDVVLSTNIPSQSEVRVPASLTVIGAPEAAVYPTAHDYGTVFTGYPYLTNFLVTNVGTDTLNVSELTTNDPNLFVEEPPGAVTTPEAAFSLEPGESRPFNLRWSPGAPYTMDAEVSIFSDDPVHPILVLDATGVAIPPPVAAWSPSSYTESLNVGDVVHRNFHLENHGGSDLDWAAGFRLLGGGPVTVHDELVFEEGDDLTKIPEPDPRPGILGTGGPDAFGYEWTDSDEPGGPVYDWTDISGIGTPVVFNASGYCTACNAGPFPLGFTFPFYGEGHTEFYVTTAGWLSFTSTSTSTSNQPLPNAGSSVPENLIAPFWDSLVLRSGTGSEPVPSNVYYYHDGTKLIVQWDNFYQLADYDTNLTFQAILYPSGRIVYQYETMQNGSLTSATVGIQNGTKDDGLTVVYNSAYIHDGMAIQFRSPYDFLQIDPPQGTVPAGGAADLDVTIDATNLIGGDYAASLDLVTNDPAHAAIGVPISLHVTGIPDVDAAPASLSFPTIFIGFTTDLPVTIKNVGTDVLTISGSSVDGEFSVSGLSTPVSLAVGEELPLVVTFAPTVDGAHAGALHLLSDDPDEPDFTVPLDGTALIPPVIQVAPPSIATALPPGGSRTKTLTVHNDGGSDLVWTSGVLELSGASSALGSGGPDAFGYKWIDSDESGGPVYDWVDISGVGTPVVFNSTGYCVDCSAGPFPMGMSFPFYENTFNEVHITTEGWISFTSDLHSFSNRPLPDAGSSTPENLIAAFWDDLVLRNGTGSETEPSTAYYYNDGSRFIVQWDHFYRIADYDTNYTFEIILYPNGKIVYQYLTMVNAQLDSATVGIQNAAKDDGLTVVYNDDYVHDGLAVQIAAAPDWVKLDPAGGVVPAGGSQDVDVLLDAAGLEDGDYQAELHLASNDPYTPEVVVPVSLHVGVIEPTYVDVDPDTVNLGANGGTVKATIELPAEFDPHDVDPCSVMLNDAVPVLGCPGTPPNGAVEFTDDWPAGGNGIQEVSFKFDRAAAVATFGPDDPVPVSVQGEVTDVQWWRGMTTVNAVRPHVTSPAGGEYYVAGSVVPVRWDAPTWGGAMTYDVLLSRDGGVTWQGLGSGLTSTSLDWTADASTSSAARVRVVAYDDAGLVLGSDDSDGTFVLGGDALGTPNPVDRMSIEKSGGGVTLYWEWPAADAGHGPATAFRVMTSGTPGGGFTETALVGESTYVDATGDPAPGEVVFYRIVSTNSAGDAE